MPAPNAELGAGFQLRVRVHSGSAAGVVATSSVSNEVWSDTVNLAPPAGIQPRPRGSGRFRSRT